MRLVFFTAVVFISGCATAPQSGEVRFQIEETNRVTFSHSGILEADATLEIRAKDLNPLDVFHLNRCGTPCNKSKLMDTLDGEQGQDQTLRFVVKEPGRYYMWVMQTLPSGEGGPVTIEQFQSDGSAFRVVFESGSRVEGTLQPPYVVAAKSTD